MPRDSSITAPDRPMRIGLVIPSLCFGGAERQVVEIARGLTRLNVDVYVITLSDYVPLLSDDGEKHFNHVVLEKKSRFDVTLIWRLAKLISRLELDVCHAFLFDAEIYTRLASLFSRNVVVIASERNSDYRLALWRKWLHMRTLTLVKMVVANSSAGALYHQSLYGLPTEKYTVIVNGVNTDKFKPIENSTARDKFDIPNSDYVIGMFASFKPQKNHAMLFRALALDERLGREVTVLLVGDKLVNDHAGSDSYRDDIEGILSNSKLRDKIILLGNNQDLRSLYNCCDVVVLPSFHEGFPNVVLEAMSCGVPCIATNVSDNHNIIQHGDNGFLVDVDDDRDLSSRLINLKEDVQNREQFGKRARAHIKDNYSTGVLARNYMKLYEQSGRSESRSK